MRPAALLFDVDGTLADTEPDGHLPAYNAAFSEFGLDWHWSTERYRALLAVSGGRERIAHYLDVADPPLRDHEAAITDDRRQWIDALHRAKSRHFRQRLAAGLVPLRPGVARLIGEARAAGLSVAIVTNASRATLDPLLEHALGPQLVAAITTSVCGDEVEAKKPAPDLYLAACRALGQAPGQCIAIEDSQTGLCAATAAGVPALVTVNADTIGQCFTGALAVLDDLGEPDMPTRIRQSPGFDFDYVDLAVLRRLCAQRPD